MIKIYMEVDLREAELPTGRMANSKSELSRMLGLHPSAVSSAITAARRRGNRCKYVEVEIDDDET